MKDRRADPFGQPAIHSANVQIDGLHAAEGAFHAREGLVAAHRCACRQNSKPARLVRMT